MATTRYGTGRATITIDGDPIVLDRLSTSGLLTGFGPEVYWFNDDGWGLRLSGGGTGLRWTDMLRDGLASGHVEGEDPFDATIEFSAAAQAPET